MIKEQEETQRVEISTKKEEAEPIPEEDHITENTTEEVTKDKEVSQDTSDLGQGEGVIYQMREMEDQQEGRMTKNKN